MKPQIIHPRPFNSKHIVSKAYKFNDYREYKKNKNKIKRKK